MRELSLHILDIARNSIEAGATAVALTIVEGPHSGRLEIVLTDNGSGMTEEAARGATDPFYSTRTTRRVGLGLALLEATCKRCGGELLVESWLGEGTTVRATMQLDHLDRPPLGDMGAVIQALACECERVGLTYRHEADGQVFAFDSDQMQQELNPARLSEPAILHWLAGYINEELRRIGSGA